MAEKDLLPKERKNYHRGQHHDVVPASPSSRSSSPGSSRASSPTDSEDSDSEPAAVDVDFAAGLEAMKAQYDREHGITRSSDDGTPAGAPPARFRTGRRAAVSIDTSEPIRDEARDKVQQAIVVSLGPDSAIGLEMIESLKHVRTVQDLQTFTARNAHNLSELGQIQVEMQMSALGAWKKGFGVLRNAMMFGRLGQGREFDDNGNEIKLTPEQIAAREAEAAARKAAAEAEREALQRARREAEEKEAAKREAERIAREAERSAREAAEREAAEREAAKQEAERLAREAAERAAERLRQEQEAKDAEITRRIAEEEAARRRAENEREAATKAAREARLQAMRKSKCLNGSRPIRTPRSARKRHKEREAALIPATKLKDDATLSQVFASLDINGAPVSTQSARVKARLGGAMRSYSRGRPSVQLPAGGNLLPIAMCASPRRGVKGSLPSVPMKRLAANQHRIEAVTLPRPSTAPGLSHLFVERPNEVRSHCSTDVS